MKYFIFYVVLLFTTQAHAWVVNANFEKGQVGSDAQGANAFSDGFENTKYTNKVVHGGSLAAVSSIEEGESAFGKWGGQIKFPENLVEGDQIWYRTWIYYPEGFSFSNNGIGVKTMRIHTRSASGENDGYFDMLTASGGMTAWIEQTGREFKDNNPTWKNLGPDVTTGVWHAFEMYAKLSSESGKGVFRLWVDGELVFEDTLTSTLKSSSSLANFVYLWSYWNGGAPKDQEAYVDDIIITNETPSAVDSHGNRFIGVGETTFKAAPMPPELN